MFSEGDVDGNKILAEALAAQVKISNKYNQPATICTAVISFAT
jgi:hypothetical protein